MKYYGFNIDLLGLAIILSMWWEDRIREIVLATSILIVVLKIGDKVCEHWREKKFIEAMKQQDDYKAEIAKWKEAGKSSHNIGGGE